jgi:glycosyltransferase involved in cell wall biosynthesis
MRLEAAGFMAVRHRDYLAQVQRALDRANLAAEFAYRGELDREGKINLLSGLDVLSVPAPYDDPKGIFLLEAMACGVPVVQPRRGAFTEIIEKTGGGVLVEPGSAEALADALFRLWRDRGTTEILAQNAFDRVRSHYSVVQSATRLLAVYEEVLRGYDVAGSVRN